MDLFRPLLHRRNGPKNRCHAVLLLVLISGCSGSRGSDDPADDLKDTPIAFPFVEETAPLGRNAPEEKFVIRSAVGAKEYAIEIPGAAQDYDVQVPIGDLGEANPEVLSGAKPRELPSPRQTDMELMGAMPSIEKSRASDTEFMDQAFGVGTTNGPKQSPSYTLGIARINRYYKDRQLEFCLVELNNLLGFYPNATQLHKMKGTVLLKMRQFKLAEIAWNKALQLDPSDRAIRKALIKLQKKLQFQEERAPDSP